MCDLSGSHYILVMIDAVKYLRNVRAWIYLNRDEWSSHVLRKTISEHQTWIEPATFWWPARRSYHWAIKTQLKPLYVNNGIMRYICWKCTIISLLTCSGFLSGLIYVELAPQLAVWVLVAHWLECLTGHQKVTGSIPVWGSETVFLRIELDERLSVIQEISKLPDFQNVPTKTRGICSISQTFNRTLVNFHPNLHWFYFVQNLKTVPDGFQVYYILWSFRFLKITIIFLFIHFLFMALLFGIIYINEMIIEPLIIWGLLFRSRTLGNYMISCFHKYL